MAPGHFMAIKNNNRVRRPVGIQRSGEGSNTTFDAIIDFSVFPMIRFINTSNQIETVNK
jgi:hypothetical protein